MGRTKLIPALIVSAVILALLIVTTVVTNSNKGNKTNTSEGESYLVALESQDSKKVENNLRNPETTKPETTDPQTEETPTDKETEAPTKAPETKPEETEAPTKEPETRPAAKPDNNSGSQGSLPAGFYGSNQSCYLPYDVDSNKASAVVDKLTAGTISTKEVFKDTLFVGDSIMTGFSDFELANKGNVIATVGAFLKPHLENNLDTVINYNPKYLVLHYGLNEMSEDGQIMDAFINNYTADIKKLKAGLPSTKIIVCGLMPVKQTAVDAQKRLKMVGKYNERIRAMCVELGVAYSEDSQLFVDNGDLYTKDGIHVQRPLYVKWINYLVKEMGIY
ncbi:MAG: GDSL-type esterase/lipase family protein [Lachnospiraceae bacterium]|nr:GDSL-type esterase/lipase family protein [Lachnospiraceae bacterium]